MSSEPNTHDIDYTTVFSVTPIEGSQVVIEGELPYAELQNERPAALKKLGENVTLDGFRPGHIPEQVLVEHVGEAQVLAEMAERAIAHHYPHILDAHKLDAVGHPQIEVTKIAPENPLGFKATVAVLPDVSLPDYQQLAKTANQNRETVAVTDAELDEKITEIMRQKQQYEQLQQKAAANPEGSRSEAGPNDLPTPETVEKPDDETATPEPLPELTDEYVKGLGQPGQFESVDDFKSKLREHLTIEKQQEAQKRQRAAITDAIVGGTELTLPQVLIDSEVQQMFAQMQEDLDRAELKMDDYLAHIKKTKEELTQEWQPAAEKRAKLQLILNEIAKAENITPEVEQVNQETESLKQRFPDADEYRVRLYVASVLTNDAVMQYLEGLE